MEVALVVFCFCYCCLWCLLLGSCAIDDCLVLLTCDSLCLVLFRRFALLRAWLLVFGYFKAGGCCVVGGAFACWRAWPCVNSVDLILLLLLTWCGFGG